MDHNRTLSSKSNDKDKSSKDDSVEQKDIESIEDLDNGTNPIGEPTTIRIPKDWD